MANTIKGIFNKNGILADHNIKDLINRGHILLENSLAAGQIQPASLDLRLGTRAHRIRASFMPGINCNVKEKLEKFKLYSIDLEKGAVLETDSVYLIELMESLDLPEDICATANPKSSTGRLDVFARVLSDHCQHFDKIRPGYKGKLFLEVCPRTFPIFVRTGSYLSQIRFSRGTTILNEEELKQLQAEKGLISQKDSLIEKQNISLSIDLQGNQDGLIGYRAKRHGRVIDIDQKGQESILDFWEPLYKKDKQIIVLDPAEFYIFSSCETVFIPPLFAAEMVPFDAAVGEFRVHYAGFFDPGFGQKSPNGEGSHAVLEVRSRDIPFIVEHGQIIGRLVFEHMLEKPTHAYGEHMGSHYQKQRLKLSKHFSANL